MKKYKIGYTSGVYDMFHIGHLNILQRAKDLCETLVVGVTTDELCYTRKNKYPIICQDNRKAIVGAIRYVDKVVDQTDMDKLNMVKTLGAEAVFVGSDWKGTRLGTNMKRSLPNWDALSYILITLMEYLQLF